MNETFPSGSPLPLEEELRVVAEAARSVWARSPAGM